MKKLRIAIIGIRGIPVPYSGFETLAEQLSMRLVQNGHKVTVYCRKGYIKTNSTQYKGISLVTISSPRSKNFETIIHSFFSTLHAILLRKFDLILFLGVGNAPISFIPRLFRIKTLLNIDGLDWQRKKWGGIGKIYLLFSEWVSQYAPSAVMTDTKYAQEYYKKAYNKAIPYIPNGFIPFTMESQKILKKYGLKKNSYFITVARLVPDNNLEELILAFKKVPTSLKCVIVGGDHYDNTYQKRIKNLALGDKRIIFTGFIPQKANLEMLKNSFAYIETKRSGGSHPSLIEAMGLGCLIIANNHPTSISILGKTGIYYSWNKGYLSLTEVIKNSLKLNSSTINSIKKSAYEMAHNYYDWDQIAKKYENYVYSLVPLK